MAGPKVEGNAGNNICTRLEAESRKEFHDVKKGDTLWKIAQEGLTVCMDGSLVDGGKTGEDVCMKPSGEEIAAVVNRLAKINDLPNPDLIRPGQRIFWQKD